MLQSPVTPIAITRIASQMSCMFDSLCLLHSLLGCLLFLSVVFSLLIHGSHSHTQSVYNHPLLYYLLCTLPTKNHRTDHVHRWAARAARAY